MGTRPIPFEAGGPLRARTAAVQQFDIFLDIPPHDCLAIITGAQEKHFERRRTVFSEFEDSVLLLLSGCLKIMQLGGNGQQIIVRLSGPGDLLGNGGRPVESAHSSSASTLQASIALVWSTKDFHSIVDRFPILQRNISRSLERQLKEIDARYREVSTEKVGARLSSQLVRLLSKVGKQADNHVEIALSQRELAQLTGTTLFTVSRLLSRWESLGIVSGRREAVLIRDVPALMDLARDTD
jgi:CRP-like cAMP-binding protein